MRNPWLRDTEGMGMGMCYLLKIRVSLADMKYFKNLKIFQASQYLLSKLDMANTLMAPFPGAVRLCPKTKSSIPAQQWMLATRHTQKKSTIGSSGWSRKVYTAFTEN